jgi:YegS/Rv2252/BmrU family lipid kinase
MRHLFIINPAAGSRNQTELYRKQIAEVCEKHGLEYSIRVSGAPGRCCKIAREAAETGKEYRIYACGGDGTLNEVVNGAAGFDNVAVTTFACGSGNDFSRMFSNPQAFRDLEQLLDAQEEEFDLIRCNEDYSLNICSVGLDARIGTDVSRYKRLPLLHGFRAYAASTVINTIKGIAEHYKIEMNGEVIDADQTLICACNGRYYGGGFNPVPEADPTDGMMEVLVVTKVSRLQVAQVVGKYKKGQYKDYPHLIRHYRTDRLVIHCDKPTPINLDGELRTAQTVDLQISDKKLRFFYPKSVTWRV